jgi:hypothetical protein
MHRLPVSGATDETGFYCYDPSIKDKYYRMVNTCPECKVNSNPNEVIAKSLVTEQQFADYAKAVKNLTLTKRVDTAEFVLNEKLGKPNSITLSDPQKKLAQALRNFSNNFWNSVTQSCEGAPYNMCLKFFTYAMGLTECQ